MPAGVVVVKRARHRSFALLWAALAWLRSVASGFRGTCTASPPAPVVPGPGPLFPALAPFEGDGPSAADLRACVEACPDDCLRLRADGDRVTALLLDPGRCTTSGHSVDQWGQGLFVAKPAPSVLATVDGRLPEIDLLREARA